MNESHQVSQLAVGGPSNKMTRQWGISIVRRVRPKSRKVGCNNVYTYTRIRFGEKMHDRSVRTIYIISCDDANQPAYPHNSMIWKVEESKL